MGFDILQQHQLFQPSEMTLVRALQACIRQKDAERLEHYTHTNSDLALAVLDWSLRSAHEANDHELLHWCLQQDGTLRAHVGGRQAFADGHAARLAWRAGVLRPVIGAGVSQAANAPGWGEMVARCIDAVTLLEPKSEKRDRLLGYSERLRADMAVTTQEIVNITQEVEDLAGVDFTPIVRGALDGMFIQPSGFLPPKSDLHCALARMAMVGAHGPGIVDIVTYNFDELLEIALLRHYGVAVAVGSFNGSWMKARLGLEETTPIRVWHPHGFVCQIPFLLTMGSPDVVFSVKAYERHYGDASSMASTIVDDSLRHKVCLFVGSSFRDDFQRAQLLRAHEAQPGWYHYALMKTPDDMVMKTSTKVGQRGKYLDHDQYIEASRDLLSLGVRPLWIEDYSHLAGAIRWLAGSVGVQVVLGTDDYCRGAVESPHVAALYSPYKRD